MSPARFLNVFLLRWLWRVTAVAAIGLSVNTSAYAQSDSGATKDRGRAGYPLRPIDKAELLGRLEELRQRDPGLYDRLRRERADRPNPVSQTTPISIDRLLRHERAEDEPGIETTTRGE